MGPAVLQIVLDTTNRNMGCISLMHFILLTSHKERHHQEINGISSTGSKTRISRGKSPLKKQNPRCLSSSRLCFLLATANKPSWKEKDNVSKTKLFTSQWTGKTARHFYLRRLKCFSKWLFVLFHNWNSAFAHGCCCTWNLKCLSEAHVVPICAPEWNYWKMVGTGAPGRSFGCYRYGWEVSLDSDLFFPSHEVRGLSLPLCHFLTTGLKAIG